MSYIKTNGFVPTRTNPMVTGPPQAAAECDCDLWSQGANHLTAARVLVVVRAVNEPSWSFTCPQRLQPMSSVVSKDNTESEKTLVGAFSWHCETSRSFVCSSMSGGEHILTAVSPRPDYPPALPKYTSPVFRLYLADSIQTLTWIKC